MSVPPENLVASPRRPVVLDVEESPPDSDDFADKTHFRGSGPELRVIERLSRVSLDAIRYDFTIDDASSFTRPWSGVLWMTRTAKRMFEYACHEGNYDVIGILRGARAAEAEREKR
jgi:hypothetical protein